MSVEKHSYPGVGNAYTYTNPKFGGKIIVITSNGATAEDLAMTMALYSRSNKSVLDHIEKVSKVGSGKFMESFYVGYGHKSIGDCGAAYIFIEGVSMLAAKCMQESRLYSGQESSTRYIDFSKVKFINPLDQGNSILEDWRHFYLDSFSLMKSFLQGKHPIKDGENEKNYVRAIEARCFDILRGFLPAGATTQLGWLTNLRQAADKIDVLRHHPLEEMREIGTGISTVLQEVFPQSFGHKPREEQEVYRAMYMEKYNYYNPSVFPDFEITTTISQDSIEEYGEVFSSRPRGVELPHFLEDLGQVQVKYLLDFGSFRDIQRHRCAIIRMPLVSDTHGFTEWYLDQMPTQLKQSAKDLLTRQFKSIHALSGSDADKQYYFPMGVALPVSLTFGLPGLLYTTELRTLQTVHPTLRVRMIEVARWIQKHFPHVAIHPDLSDDVWSIKRGSQTIEEK